MPKAPDRDIITGVHNNGDSSPSRPWLRPLLDSLVADSLDPSYARAAALARPDPTPRKRWRSLLVIALTIAAIVVVMVVAAKQAQASKEPAERIRADLTRELQARTQAGQELAARNEQLRQAAAAAARQQPTTAGGSTGLLAEVAQLPAVQCEGVKVTITETAVHAGATPGRVPGGAAVDRVSDRDLQRVVNGLNAVGAQAVAVGEQRLTNNSSIRMAGQAILVNYQPQIPPYVVRACGHRQQLEEALTTGSARLALHPLEQAGKVTVIVAPMTSMELPAGAVKQMRYATTDRAAG